MVRNSVMVDPGISPAEAFASEKAEIKQLK